MTAGSQALGPVKTNIVVNELLVHHGTGGIIHGTGNHADKGKSQVVVRGNIPAPLVIFIALKAFKCQHIRPCAVQAGGFIGPVIIHQQLPLGSGSGHSFIVIHHILVSPLHEIHLHPCCTPVFINR